MTDPAMQQTDVQRLREAVVRIEQFVSLLVPQMSLHLRRNNETTIVSVANDFADLRAHFSTPTPAAIGADMVDAMREAMWRYPNDHAGLTFFASASGMWVAKPTAEHIAWAKSDTPTPSGENDAAGSELKAYIARGRAARDHPVPVDAAATTVAFVQEWMMSGDHEPDQWHRDFAAAIDARAASPDDAGDAGEGRAIPMILHCPRCHLQHIDEPDERTPEWQNPPHRSHLCHGCGFIWRPADVATEGVAAIKTVGKADTLAQPAPDTREVGENEGPAEWAVNAERAATSAYSSYMGDPNDDGYDDPSDARRAAALAIERHAVAALATPGFAAGVDADRAVFGIGYRMGALPEHYRASEERSWAEHQRITQARGKAPSGEGDDG